MTCLKAPFVKLICLLILIAGSQIPVRVVAEIDPFNEMISEHYPAALRWDNIERHNEDFSDNKFIYKDKLHQVILNSEEKVYIQLNKGEYLRLLSTKNNLDSQLINIEASQDGLLFAHIDYIKGDNNKNIIVKKESQYNRIVQITNKGKNKLVLALFVSRKDYIKKLLPYRDLVNLNLDSYLLTRNPGWNTKSYYLLPENKNSYVQIEGPKRLLLKIRMKYKKYQFGQQKIQLRYAIDKHKDTISHIITNLDHSASYTLNYRNLKVSREERIYLDIPEGKHKLKLHLSDAAFIRLLALDNPDYLFPELNSTSPKIQQIKRSYKNARISADNFLDILKQGGYDYRLYNTQWVAHYLAINNQIRESALDAIALLKKSAEENKGLKEAEHYSLTFNKRHSFFRNLKPYNEEQIQHKEFQFVLSELRTRNKYPEQTYLMEENLSPLCKINKADFYSPVHNDDVMHFRLPERKQTVDLRIIVSNPSSLSHEKLFVQFDQQTPKLFKLENLLLNKIDYFNTQVSEACLSLNKKRRAQKRLYPYEQYHSLSRVSFYTLKIPSVVKEIKIWRERKKTEKAPLALALQYQAAKAYTMDDSLYLNIISHIKNDAVQNYLFPVLNDETVDLKKLKHNHLNQLSSDEVYRLEQNWQTLKLFVLSRKKIFSANYRYQENKTGRYSTEDKVNLYFKKMKKAKKTRNWFNVIELFSELNINPDYQYYVAVHKLFYIALEQQREIVLRERLLRGKFLYDKNILLKKYAYEQLEQYYQTNDLDERLMQLYVIRALQTESEKDLRVLTNYLIDQGYYLFGLQLGLLLKADQSLIEELLRAAWNLQQWDYFDFLLNKLNSKKNNSLWKLLKVFSTGNEKDIKRLISINKGKQYYINGFIDKALKLHQALTTKNDLTIVKAWTEYRQWLNLHNKHKVWRNADKLVTSTYGTLTLYNLERNLYKTYYKLNAESHLRNKQKGKGIRINIIGPARIRFNVRILYDSINDKTSTTNLTLKDNKQIFSSTIYKSIPTYGKTINEIENKIPGTMQEVEYTVGEGSHRLELSINRASAIVSLSAEQPAIMLPFIPEFMTEQLLASIVRSDDNVKTASVTKNMPECLYRGCIFLFKNSPNKNQQIILSRITDINNLEMEQEFIRHFDNTYILNQKDFFTENRLNTVYFEKQFASLCLYNNKRISLPVKITSLDSDKAKNNQIVKNCINKKDNEDKALNLLLQLLWYINQHPNSYNRIEPMAGAILDAFSYLPDFRKFITFFDYQSRWQLINSVVESAGMKRETITGWNPMTTSSKIRKALISVQNASFVLMDSGISGISFSNFLTTKLQIKIENKSFPFQTKQDIRLRYKFDMAQWQYITVNRSKNFVKLALEMSGGDHSLKFQWLNPVANQYIPITLESINKQGHQFLTGKQDFFYHVATPDEPVIVNIMGPKRIKVYARVDNDEVINYLYIKPGWQQLTLNNIPDSENTLYRIYQRIIAENIRRPESIRTTKELAPLPFGQWFNEMDVITDEQTKTTIKIEDKYPLGKQEDGTFAFGALWTEGPDREDSLNDTQQSDYYEFNISHYYFYEQLNTYFDSKILYREPDTSSAKPVYGFEETVFIKPDWLAFSIRYDYRFYTQDYISLNGTARAWATSQRLGIEKLFNINPKWSHLPKLTLFKKHYSNNGFINQGNIDLDYDVWSQYGDIHNEGIIAADTVYYYPWLDTRLSSGFKYYSDEYYDFSNPEHVTLNIGWLQLLDKFIINMDYRWSYYYKQNERNWNRSANSNKAIFNTDIFWESWVSPTERILTNLKFSFDSKENDISTTLGFVYYFDHGRGFRDFRPHSMSFRDLRERHRYWNVNNTFGSDSSNLEKNRVK